MALFSSPCRYCQGSILVRPHKDHDVHLGRTKTSDIDVNVNPEVMVCDLKIALGAVTPHPANGFCGSSKIVLPEICSYETVVDHHLKSFKIAFDAMNKAASERCI